MTDKMQFGSFSFHHNPQSITIKQNSGTAVHFCPGQGEVVQDLGKRCRMITCRGAFFGNSFEEAARQMAQFRQAAGEGTAETLFVPGIAPFSARLQELVFEASGDGRILPYTIVFVEARVGA